MEQVNEKVKSKKGVVSLSSHEAVPSGWRSAAPENVDEFGSLLSVHAVQHQRRVLQHLEVLIQLNHVIAHHEHSILHIAGNIVGSQDPVTCAFQFIVAADHHIPTSGYCIILTHHYVVDCVFLNCCLDLRQQSDDISQLVVKSQFLSIGNQIHVYVVCRLGMEVLESQRRRTVSWLSQAAPKDWLVCLEATLEVAAQQVLQTQRRISLRSGAGFGYARVVIIRGTFKVDVEESVEVVDGGVGLGHESGVDGQVLEVVDVEHLCVDGEEEWEDVDRVHGRLQCTLFRTLNINLSFRTFYSLFYSLQLLPITLLP